MAINQINLLKDFISEINDNYNNNLESAIKERLDKNLKSYLDDLYFSYAQICTVKGDKRVIKELNKNGNKS